MAKILTLDSHVADLIAAGEVVERPASVVKELVENAIDAGAGSVTVEITRGGMSLIRVTDNGCGIPADEVETAFLRHATSKIRDEYDLEAIGTLGFRGEALAAISAVSRIDVLSRTQDAALGASLRLEGGVVAEREEAGCPQGTTMVVRDLFFNTPARLKFMKRDAAEGASVFAMVQRVALSHPEVSVRFLRDGKQELLTPGDGQLKSAIYSVFGRDIALGFTPIKGSGEGITVSGFASLPVCCRGTRGYQHFYVNGRYVKSRTMTAALEAAYANQKMVGKFPGCVLHVNTKLNMVDVNVHPAKTEVKFVNEHQIFDAMYHGVLSSLTGETFRPTMTVTTPLAGIVKEDTVTPNQTVLQVHDSIRPVFAPSVGKTVTEVHIEPGKGGAVPYSVSRPEPEVRPLPIMLNQNVPNEPKPQTVPERVLQPELTEKLSSEPTPVAKPEPNVAFAPSCEPEITPWRMVGELFSTYIVVEQGETALLIDKHAAHERMWFDRLKAGDTTPMGQMLLTPLTMTPTPEERVILVQNLPLLQEFGFEVEEFGGGALIVRQIPDYLDVGGAEAALTDLAERLLTTGCADPAAARDELLHTVACKAAIKGGQKNSPSELQRVAEAVMRGEVKYCPHGRPVAIELTHGQLDRQFKRA